jgi:hypothetical protein
MAVTWDNNGEPVNGFYIARLTFPDAPPQVFKGTSYKEVADNLLKAQEHASNAIRELKAGRTPEPAKPRRRAEAKPLTAGERMTIAAEITDPHKSAQAITRVVESVVGPVEVIREAVNKMDDEEEAREAHDAAALFASSTPDWYPSQYNIETLANYMRYNNYAPTSSNFEIAYGHLRAANLLQSRPPESDEEEQTEEPPKPNGHGGKPPQTVRPRGTLTATSIRASDTSGSPRPARPKYTRAQIDGMSAATFKEKMNNEPGFREFVDSLK